MQEAAPPTSGVVHAAGVQPGVQQAPDLDEAGDKDEVIAVAAVVKIRFCSFVLNSSAVFQNRNLLKMSKS